MGYGGHGILIFDMNKDHSIIKKVGPFSNGIRPFTLKDEFHNYVASEKMVEVHFSEHQVIKAGDQFGIGRAGK